jgi:hypothetical protein
MKNPKVFNKTSEGLGADKFETYAYQKLTIIDHLKLEEQAQVKESNMRKVMIVPHDFNKANPIQSLTLKPHFTEEVTTP